MLKIEVNSSYLEILNLVDNLKSIGQEGLYQKPVLRFSIFGVLYFNYVPFDPPKEIIYVDNYYKILSGRLLLRDDKTVDESKKSLCMKHTISRGYISKSGLLILVF